MINRVAYTVLLLSCQPCRQIYGALSTAIEQRQLGKKGDDSSTNQTGIRGASSSSDRTPLVSPARKLLSLSNGENEKFLNECEGDCDVDSGTFLCTSCSLM